MYPLVKLWLQRERDCIAVSADLPKEKYRVRLQRLNRRRDVDVAGVERSRRGRFLVHLAEGKDFVHGASAHECLGQAQSVLKYADFGWVFFPAQQWDKLPPKELNDIRGEVEARNLGLLIVDVHKGYCRLVVDPKRNSAVLLDNVELVLNQMGHGPEHEFPEGNPVSASARGLAARALAIGTKAENALGQALQGKVRRSLRWESWDESESYRHRWYSRDAELEDGFRVTVDPFGMYLKDGVSCAWFWMERSRQEIEELAGRSSPAFGTHVYFDNDAWEWHLLPLRSVSRSRIATLARKGFDYGGADLYFVGHRLRILGVKVAELKLKVQRVYAAARALKRSQAQRRGPVRKGRRSHGAK
jgi:hypothetical protein